MTIEEQITEAVRAALEPYLARLAEPEPLVYSVPEAAKVMRTSTNTIRRLVGDGHLPIVPHMNGRVLIPRVALRAFVNGDAQEPRPSP